jgi:hypothetical protein
VKIYKSLKVAEKSPKRVKGKYKNNLSNYKDENPLKNTNDLIVILSSVLYFRLKI